MGEAAGVGQKIPTKKALFSLCRLEMEHDRKINLFCSELYLPLVHTGWRGHHRIACVVSQRRKGPLLHPTLGAAFGPRTDCSSGQPDEIKPQPSPSHHCLFLCTIVLPSFPQLTFISTMAFAGRSVSRQISASAL